MIAKRGNSEDWTGENRHTRVNNSGSFVIQQGNRIGNEFRVCQGKGVQVKED